MKTIAVLVIEYAQSRTRAWNFLQSAVQGLNIHSLVDCGRVQVLLVEAEHGRMDDILQVVRDDIRSDLRQAYWLGSPDSESRVHINGNSAGGQITPYSNPEVLRPPEP